ncbi:hypothetical protein DSO57_1020793 [Entomophthora muscae]|uniref:Uncharacterized protein n=1 Tax=Entomophthora muscae TaxID=34485 RepID=A0ACC2SGC0_9FUNG|nr:hypothetical protein DSO57_1020793 [Entomophthora muscae]
MHMRLGRGWLVVRGVMMDPLLLMAMMVACRGVMNMGRIVVVLDRVGRWSYQLCTACERVVQRMSLQVVWESRHEILEIGGGAASEVIGMFKWLNGVGIGGIRCALSQGWLGTLMKKVGVDEALDTLENTLNKAIRTLSGLMKSTPARTSHFDPHLPRREVPPLCDQLAMEEAIATVQLVVRYMQYCLVGAIILVALAAYVALVGLGWTTERAPSKVPSRLNRTLLWPIHYLNYANAHRCLVMALLCLVSMQAQRKAVQTILRGATDSFSEYSAAMSSNLSLHLNYIFNDLGDQASFIWDWIYTNWLEEIPLSQHLPNGMLELFECIYLRKFKLILEKFIPNRSQFTLFRDFSIHWEPYAMRFLAPQIHTELKDLESHLVAEGFITASIFLTAYVTFLIITAAGTILNYLSLFKPSPQDNFS